MNTNDVRICEYLWIPNAIKKPQKNYPTAVF